MSTKRNFLDGTVIANSDESDSTYNYYGRVRMDGSWVIQREKKADPKEYKYALGSSNYSTNWSNKSSLTYKTVQEISANLPFGTW